MTLAAVSSAGRGRLGSLFRTAVVALALVAGIAPSVLAADGQRAQRGGPNSFARSRKLDRHLEELSASGRGSDRTPVIVELQPGADVPAEFARYARRGGRLRTLRGQVLDIPNSVLARLSAHGAVLRVHHDRPTFRFNYRTSITVGTRAVQQTLGLTGAGIGVAVVDSGISTWHDDLTNPLSTVYPYGNQRLAAFVDFVNGRSTPYDDDGHGTHVAGVIAGNGFDSAGQKAGAAPDASIISLKVLDASGAGTISTIIKALDWVLDHHTQYNIRVVNLSVGATVTESYWTDPLTLAAKRLVDAGIVVVGASGNYGKNAAGETQYGGVTAPGNAPWVLTVGASSTNGTTSRGDDSIAGFSSRGPTYLDWAAKPDLVAPGVGTVSLAEAGSTLAQRYAAALTAGTVSTASPPYLSLSGTSMAAPVVAGTVALMLEANPTLTPNAVKAILQYTAQAYAGYNTLTEGAGFLNAVGAVRLARFFATHASSTPLPVQASWSRTVVWGNERLSGGQLDITAHPFGLGTVWGAGGGDGDQIVWGTGGPDGDQIVWGTGTTADNIVWGTRCGGSDCDQIVWGTGSERGDQIVWGTGGGDGDQIVWGTGGGDGDQIVWGTTAGSQTVWGGTANVFTLVSEDGSRSTVSGDVLFDQMADEALLQWVGYTVTPPVPETPAVNP